MDSSLIKQVVKRSKFDVDEGEDEKTSTAQHGEYDTNYSDSVRSKDELEAVIVENNKVNGK